uniref:Serpentine receptor class gamma n=1 Tax=Caenorhabditis tropicalis TaxID=1561998 RepID=A0A1I7UXP0_9PELO
MSDFTLFSANPEIDPLYVDCDLSYDNRTEILKFSIQFVYLTFGILLNLRVLSTILWRCRGIYMSNSFFVLFSMDCLIVSI